MEKKDPSVNFGVVAIVGLWAKFITSRKISRRAELPYEDTDNSEANNWLKLDLEFKHI